MIIDLALQVAHDDHLVSVELRLSEFQMINTVVLLKCSPAVQLGTLSSPYVLPRVGDHGKQVLVLGCAYAAAR